MQAQPGILLSNLGTPEAPTAAALRPYLRQFLSDRRVIEAPRLVWWLVLNLFILPFRPRRSARLYARIWTEEGSPLLVVSKLQAKALARSLEDRIGVPIPVAVGMRYGEPSIAEGLGQLRNEGCDSFLALPLYPQYSAATVGTTCDAVFTELSTWRRVPGLRTVTGYHDDPAYIAALAASIRESWAEHGPAEHLLLSFHGLPQRYADAGDPYPEHCATTSRLVANELDLEDRRWTFAFQSRFGREKWLEPYTDEVTTRLASEKIASLDVVCPGFSADCLETLEEIDVALRKTFESHGGGRFRYIRALNDRSDHVEALAGIAAINLRGWICAS